MLEGLALARGALDRMAESRTDAASLERVREEAFIVGVCGDAVAMSGAHLRDCTELPREAALLLGTTANRTYVAVLCDEPGEDFRSLREVGVQLSDDEAAIATTAVALHQWHRTHTHCPRCGTPTEIAAAGWERHCPADGSAHFPRTDPAVIVVIVDAADRLLLARQTVWAHNRFSLVAGYVEPGESAENAVVREVLEEVGLHVDQLAFLGSQPWPFPASLMLCYRAHATTDTVRVDGSEIAEAMWVSRTELPKLLASGRLALPSHVSVARRAIEDWYGSTLG